MVSAALASALTGIVIAWAIIGATMLWLTTDIRPAIAVLIGWEWLLAPGAAFAAIRGTWLTGSYYLALAVPLAAAAVALAIRRPARQPRPEPTGPR